MNHMVVNRPSDARHFCRVAGCRFVLPPGRNAHKRVAEHRQVVHGLSTGNGHCHMECGYMARPLEGRFIDAQESDAAREQFMAMEKD